MNAWRRMLAGLGIARDAPGVIRPGGAHLGHERPQLLPLRFGGMARRELGGLQLDRSARLDDMRQLHLGRVQRVLEHLHQHVGIERVVAGDRHSSFHPVARLWEPLPVAVVLRSVDAAVEARELRSV